MTHTEDIEFNATNDMGPFDRGLSEGSSIKESRASYSPTQQLALTRYIRVSMLRRDVLPMLESTDWRARLIHKALYSAYRDCEQQGLDNEVRLLRERSSAPS